MHFFNSNAFVHFYKKVLIIHKRNMPMTVAFVAANFVFRRLGITYIAVGIHVDNLGVIRLLPSFENCL